MAQPDPVTDAQLIRRVLAGEQAAYRPLVERHQTAVFNAAYRLLGQRDEAADISQEAFLRAYRALETVALDRPLAPWLCRIAINLALNRLKQRRPTVSLDDAGLTAGAGPLEIADATAEPQGQVLAQERQAALRQALVALPPEHKAVIELRHFQEQSYDEMAETLGLSLATVKSRLFRARRQLRQILEKRGEV